MLIIIFFISLIIQPSNIFAQDGGVGFTYTINKADTTPIKTSVIDFSEQELLYLPGKSVKDNEVKSLINQKEFYWDVVRDTVASQNPDVKPGYSIQKTYYNYKKGFAMIIESDTLKRIVLYNDYEERPYRIWKKYTGKLPYKLDFDLKRVFVERLLGKPDEVGSKAETVIYLNRHLFITYFGADPESAIITSITIEKK